MSENTCVALECARSPNGKHVWALRRDGRRCAYCGETEFGVSYGRAMKDFADISGETVKELHTFTDYEPRFCRPEEAPITVKELHTFTDAEMEVIADALKIANAHYRTLAEVSHTRYASEFRQEFERQAEEASALQLKIEASR